MPVKLRPYQEDIINQTIKSDKHTLIQIPTGGGKTVIAKEIISDLVGRFDKQVLFVAPKIILMEQTAEVFKGLNPHIMHGVQKYDKTHKVLISTIQTGSRRDISPDVIIIDEIHYGFEGKMLEKLIKDKPNTRVIGLSATPYDKNGKQLEGFELTLDKYDMKYMVDNNYLVDIKPYILTKIRKLDDIQITAGDYNLKELGKIVCDNQTILEIVKSTAEYIKKYKKTIVFAVDINHAELLTKAYMREGFTAKALHSKLSKDDIKREIRLFKEDQTKILVSVLMLTTGFDVPDVEVAVIARPTKSQNLYKQMVGRVLRLAKNKTQAILLDCGNVIENLGLPLEPIKIIQANEINNKQKCNICNSKNIKLRTIKNNFFWVCLDCGYKKPIEQGVYECKYCKQLHTHSGSFITIKNKLYLDCDNCGVKTLISEYTGNEKLLEIKKELSDISIIKDNFIQRLSTHIKSKEAILNNEDFNTYLNSEALQKKIVKFKETTLVKYNHKYNINQNMQRKFEQFVLINDIKTLISKDVDVKKELPNIDVLKDTFTKRLLTHIQSRQDTAFDDEEYNNYLNSEILDFLHNPSFNSKTSIKID